MRRAVFSRRNPRDEVDAAAAAPDALADDQGDQVAPPVAAPANNNNPA